MLSQGQALTHPTQTSTLKFNHFRTRKKINFKQNMIWGCPLKPDAGTFDHLLIFQFATICSALSASRPELSINYELGLGLVVSLGLPVAGSGSGPLSRYRS